MTRLPNYGQRKARGGKGLLPPNPKQWENEHNGLDVREALGLGLDTALSHDGAFGLLPGVKVMGHGDLPMAQVFIEHFRNGGSRAWSGMGIPLPGGGAWVIFNDSHPINRVRATLMEEFFHLWLGHPATSVRVYRDTATRSYDRRVESEAYGSGAAALVPYSPLRDRLRAGEPVGRIAARFGVSQDLVMFRVKVTKLYGSLRRR
jgi:uncharacterized protein DUF955